MQVRNPDVNALIERISIHYTNNVGNRYLRPSFMSMSLDNRTWELVASITEKYKFFSAQGFHLDELYDRIIALARFVYAARKETGPNLRTLLGGHAGSSGGKGEDRVLRDMAVNNFSSNLGILADLINELYVLTVDIDTKMHKNAVPVYKNIPELQNLGRYLLG
jgi:hypothetical protein